MKKINYREDLNGIRAIAIIGIILFHYNINFFDGAVISIDIFFVLSGYLITSVLLKNENNLSISIFWINRARRVIPLLLLIVIVSIPFAFFLMIPLYFANFAQSVFFTPIFLSNILFWLESGYWDLPSQIKPLLHTWSIAVEGQFYILFPLIFLIKEKKKILNIIIFIWIISLAMAIFKHTELLTIQTDKFLSLADHFMPFGRWWQLMSGSIVAFFFKYKKNFKFRYSNFFSIFGLFLILISVLLFSNTYAYPGALSVIPVGGTVLMLVYSRKNNFVYKFLSLKFMNHIGEISYSLYLWHFPILVFSKYFLNQNINNISLFIMFVLTYGLSLFSYRYVETPFYKKKILNNKIFIIFTIISIFTISSSGLYLKSNNFFFSNIAKETENIKNEFSQYNFGNSLKTNITIGDNFSNNQNTIKLLIIGDSHGRDLTRALYSFSQNNEKYEFRFLELNDFETNSQINSKNNKSKLLIDNSEYILISKQFTSEKNQISKIKKLAKISRDLNKKFVIVGSAPEFYTSEGDVLLTFLLENKKNREYLRNHDYDLINKYFFSKLKTYLFDTNDVLQKVAKDLNVHYLDRFDFTCDIKNKKCFGLDKYGNKLFMDYSHFTQFGVNFFGNQIYKLNWLNKINY